MESLVHKIFSVQSDVWSFGIFLWEMLTLCQQGYPYLEMSDAAQLIRHLQAGYRLEKPDRSPTRIGRLMTSCWNRDPKQRPSFRHLEEILGAHLATSFRDRYVDMNAPFDKFNEEIKAKTRAAVWHLSPGTTRRNLERYRFNAIGKKERDIEIQQHVLK